MKEQYRYFITKFIAVFVIFTLDQASKYYVLDYFKAAGKKVEYVCEYLNIVLIWNQGISFGFFNKLPYSNQIFLLISVLIVIILCLMLIKSDKKNHSISYILIISGALGNIFDRIERGAVVDFIEVHYHNYFFPVFNIADSVITIGVLVLLFEMIFLENKRE